VGTGSRRGRVGSVEVRGTWVKVTEGEEGGGYEEGGWVGGVGGGEARATDGARATGTRQHNVS